MDWCIMWCQPAIYGMNGKLMRRLNPAGPGGLRPPPQPTSQGSAARYEPPPPEPSSTPGRGHPPVLPQTTDVSTWTPSKAARASV